LGHLRLPPVNAYRDPKTKVQNDFQFPNKNKNKNPIFARPPINHNENNWDEHWGGGGMSIEEHRDTVKGDKDDAWLVDAIVEHSENQEISKEKQPIFPTEGEQYAIYHL